MCFHSDIFRAAVVYVAKEVNLMLGVVLKGLTRLVTGWHHYYEWDDDLHFILIDEVHGRLHLGHKDGLQLDAPARAVVLSGIN